MKKLHPVFVLGLYLPGIDIIKQFKKQKIQCVGISSDRKDPGLKLKNVKTYYFDNPDKNKKKWADFLIGLAGYYEYKPLLLNTSDAFIKAIDNNQEVLKKHFIFNLSYQGIREKFLSKSGLIEAAKNANIDYPETYKPENKEELTVILDTIKYPCIIKPKLPYSWWFPEIKALLGDNKVVQANDSVELVEWYDKIASLNNEMIIQEIIPGPDTNLYYLVAYINRKGECLGYFCGQKIRITPIHFGSASYMKTVENNEVAEKAIQLLKINKYEGPAGVEFKFDPRDNMYKLIEVNARYGLWDVIGKKLGVNVFDIAYNDLVDGNRTTYIPKKINWYWISLSRDITTFFEYKREKLIGWKGWIKSFVGKVYFEDLYFNEPSVMYNIYLKRILRKILKICKK